MADHNASGLPGGAGRVLQERDALGIQIHRYKAEAEVARNIVSRDQPKLLHAFRLVKDVPGNLKHRRRSAQLSVGSL